MVLFRGRLRDHVGLLFKLFARLCRATASGPPLQGMWVDPAQIPGARAPLFFIRQSNRSSISLWFGANVQENEKGLQQAFGGVQYKQYSSCRLAGQSAAI